MSSITARFREEGRSSIGATPIREDTFEAFFKLHYPRMCVYCKFKYGFDVELAQDITSASFIKLWEICQALGVDVPPTAYLSKIIDNQCLNILKHDKVKKQHIHYLLRTSSEGVSPATFESIDLKQLRAAIEATMAELPDQMRKIFELSRVQGLKYAEIASELNISVKTVETQIRRALAKFREKLSGFLTIYFTVLAVSYLMKA